MQPMAFGGWASAIGSGLWFTIWALYLTEWVGLSGAQTGIALSIAGAVGFLAPAPLGRVADRRGPREVYATLLAAEGIIVGGFVFCHSFLAVVLVASATAACDQGKTGVRTALVTQLATGERRVGALASLRASSHAGDALGAALGDWSSAWVAAARTRPRSFSTRSATWPTPPRCAAFRTYPLARPRVSASA
jgi:predicted MFS family arabinose efflux permease